MFDIANVSLNVIILLLRITIVFLLYFFLWQIMRVIRDDLRHSANLPTTPVTPYGQLVVINAGPTGLPVGKVFPLGPIITIGRSTSSDVSLNDTFLSSEHARLERRGNEWILEDLRSTNGTFLNGFEVCDATSVNNGDIIRIGRVELKLVTG